MISKENFNSLEASYYINEAIKSLSLLNESEEDFKTGDSFEWNIKQSTKNVNSVEGAKEYFDLLKNKIKNLSDNQKKKAIKVALVSLLMAIGLSGGLEPELGDKNNNGFEDEVEQRELIMKADEISKDLNVNYNEPTKNNKVDKSNKSNDINSIIKNTPKGKKLFIKPETTEISDALLKHLKDYEGFSATAYNLKDGAKTIGYGHAIFPNNKKKEYDFLPAYKDIIVGKTKVTEKQAELMLANDYKEAKAELDKIFDNWKAEGIEYVITQEMYDSMISLIFNRGISAFRNSDFIQFIKKGPKFYEKASDSIKTMSSHNFKKYPGLVSRRKSEFNLFNKGLDVVKTWIKNKLS